MKENQILNFLGEAGILKRVARSGWWVLGLKNPETVAEHSFRTAVVSFILARLEKVNPYRASLMGLFNDIHEARINDLHKLGQVYIDFKAAEEKVFFSQVEQLPKAIKTELKSLRLEYDAQKTKAAIVARDADILECLIQAKEYSEYGFRNAHSFFAKAERHLKTKSAKKLWQKTKRWDLNRWWQELSEFER
jgi:putative hydrolase of HD superfamily